MRKPTDTEIKTLLQDLTENDVEFMQELIEAYIENLEEFRTETYAAVEQKDITALKASIHKINPTLLTLKYEKEFEMLIAMKDSLNENSAEDNHRLVRTITDRAIAQLKRIQESDL